MPGIFRSPLSADAVNGLAQLLYSGAGMLSGSISAHDAGRVLSALAHMHARERVHVREAVRREEAEMSGDEYVLTSPRRDGDGVPIPSEIITEMLLSLEMQCAFALLLSIVKGVQNVPQNGSPFGALGGYASKDSAQAQRLIWYLRAIDRRDADPDRSEKMRELRPFLRVWGNTLPAAERRCWSAMSALDLKPCLDAIEESGERVWYLWSRYTAKLGLRIENFDPCMELDLPIYEPFSSGDGYTPPAARPLPSPAPLRK